ncbi:MAG: hypothetical protein O3B96_00650, partial [bacterium]|nr:hypothetical protein [bacterium]
RYCWTDHHLERSKDFINLTLSPSTERLLRFVGFSGGAKAEPGRPDQALPWLPPLRRNDE